MFIIWTPLSIKDATRAKVDELIVTVVTDTAPPSAV